MIIANANEKIVFSLLLLSLLAGGARALIDKVNNPEPQVYFDNEVFRWEAGIWKKSQCMSLYGRSHFMRRPISCIAQSDKSVALDHYCTGIKPVEQKFCQL